MKKIETPHSPKGKHPKCAENTPKNANARNAWREWSLLSEYLVFGCEFVIVKGIVLCVENKNNIVDFTDK